MNPKPRPTAVPSQRDPGRDLLHEIAGHLRQNRPPLRDEWVRRTLAAGRLTALPAQELQAEAGAVYDHYADALESSRAEGIARYARGLCERALSRGVEADEVLAAVLTLRDVLARGLLARYATDPPLLQRVLDAFEPAANRISGAVVASFVQERERVICEQQQAIRELSTPVLPVRSRLLILPMVGLIDPDRARRLTEQLLHGIRAHRAKVVVMDITGVPSVDAATASHLVQTAEASRLMGAEVIITGLSAEAAHTLATLGVDLSKLRAIGDLQGGLEEAERLLGYRVLPAEAVPRATGRRRQDP